MELILLLKSSTELDQALQLEQEAHQRRRRAGVEVGQRCPEPEPEKEQLLVFCSIKSESLKRVTTKENIIKHKRGPHSTINSLLALHPAAPCLILGFPNNFSLDVAEIY